MEEYIKIFHGSYTSINFKRERSSRLRGYWRAYIRYIFKRSPAFLSIPSSSSVIVDDPRSISRRPSEELARSASRYLAAYTQRDTRVCVLATRVPTAQRRNGSIPNLSWAYLSRRDNRVPDRRSEKERSESKETTPRSACLASRRERAREEKKRVERRQGVVQPCSYL